MGGTTGGDFEINASTGPMTVASSAARTFETTPGFSLTVSATDTGSPALSGSNTVTVNLTNVNEAPVVAAATFSIAENRAEEPGVGEEGTTRSAPDHEKKTTHTYSGRRSGRASDTQC